MSRERPRRGTLPPRIELQWSCERTAELGRIVALCGGDLAVARVPARDGRPRSRLLVRDGQGWQIVEEVADAIEGLWQLRDGSLIASGHYCCVHGQIGATRVVPHGQGLFRGAWGPSSSEVHALAQAGLLLLDGARWRRVELDAPGLAPPSGPLGWNHGTCDSSGRGWLVGTDRKHAWLLTGRGAAWEVAAPLGLAAADLASGADGTLFVRGSQLWPVGRAAHRGPSGEEGAAPGLDVRDDPRWPAHGGSWRPIDEYKDFPVWPQSMACYGESAKTSLVVLGCALQEAQEPGREMFVFHDAQWRVFTLPEPLTPWATRCVTRDGRLMLSDGEAIWESSPIAAALA